MALVPQSYLMMTDICPPQVRELLNSLDRRRSYFTITHFAELLLTERIMIPCDLKVGQRSTCLSQPATSGCSRVSCTRAVWVGLASLRCLPLAWSQQQTIHRVSDDCAVGALQLTLFSAGGPQDGNWAPHLTIIAIPLLSAVRLRLPD